ncbi:MAG: ankyrin repeat domain-containing protein [Acidobacteria bacterium]|nr:ankyrin repeat domain-containing protein [Acidobacteriota bacterium]
MQVLAEGGANPRTVSKDLMNPLLAIVLLAAKRPKQAMEASDLALRLGVDINGADKDGQTALHEAASVGSLELIRYLVGKGANLGAKNKKGRTPLEMVEAGEVETDEYSLNPPEPTAKLLRELATGK